ncbi:hypothetical protein ACFQYP_59545 [Nonomuraea antimicrobica]
MLTVTAHEPDGLTAGTVKGLGTPEHGPFARLRRTPAQVADELGGRPALAVTMRGPLDDLSEIVATAKELDAVILLLPSRTARPARPSYAPRCAPRSSSPRARSWSRSPWRPARSRSWTWSCASTSPPPTARPSTWRAPSRYASPARRTAAAWWSSSPACQAPASPRSPAACATRCWSWAPAR